MCDSVLRLLQHHKQVHKYLRNPFIDPKRSKSIFPENMLEQITKLALYTWKGCNKIFSRLQSAGCGRNHWMFPALTTSPRSKIRRTSLVFIGSLYTQTRDWRAFSNFICFTTVHSTMCFTSPLNNFVTLHCGKYLIYIFCHRYPYLLHLLDVSYFLFEKGGSLKRDVKTVQDCVGL